MLEANRLEISACGLECLRSAVLNRRDEIVTTISGITYNRCDYLHALKVLDDPCSSMVDFKAAQELVRSFDDAEQMKGVRMQILLVDAVGEMLNPQIQKEYRVREEEYFMIADEISANDRWERFGRASASSLYRDDQYSFLERRRFLARRSMLQGYLSLDCGRDSAWRELIRLEYKYNWILHDTRWNVLNLIKETVGWWDVGRILEKTDNCEEFTYMAKGQMAQWLRAKSESLLRAGQSQLSINFMMGRMVEDGWGIANKLRGLGRELMLDSL